MILKAVTVVPTAIVVCTVGPGEVVGDAEPCLYRIRKKISHHLIDKNKGKVDINPLLVGEGLEGDAKLLTE